ncbi:Geranylgeranyl pyrophosphate synthase [Pseudomonas syringae pv. actinidiae]|uniref:Geranylgeranyl pyrophosphate synthase n=1 Tax=Pseudomonas syringae pv. actinidiae TaxID=103796 RepID=A0AAN4QBW3_PSESF|nr:Geranylgeranyl pyrophosphate synthase [Pseudomonas syringae pv. actinidiae]
MGNRQRANHLSEGRIKPTQASGALFGAILQRGKQTIPEIFQQSLSHCQRKADAAKMILVRQAFTQPGHQHQVFAVFRDTSRSQLYNLFPVGLFQIGLPVALSQIVDIGAACLLDLIEQAGKTQVFARATLNRCAQCIQRKVVEDVRHGRLCIQM